MSFGSDIAGEVARIVARRLLIVAAVVAVLFVLFSGVSCRVTINSTPLPQGAVTHD